MPIETDAWVLRPPKAGTRDSLVVEFTRPLDYGLLHRVIQVENETGAPVEGVIVLAMNETRWRFTPTTAWVSGTYTLVVNRVLEDLAGNSVGRPFEVEIVDAAETIDYQPRQRFKRIDFEIHKPD